MSYKILFLLSFQFLLLGQLRAQKLVNQIVAQVGDNIILWSDIETQRLQLSEKERVLNGKECQILEQLLLEELLVNQALIDSLVISNEQVDAEMENRLRIMESKMGGRLGWLGKVSTILVAGGAMEFASNRECRFQHGSLGGQRRGKHVGGGD